VAIDIPGSANGQLDDPELLIGQSLLGTAIRPRPWHDEREIDS
jgi:hypothetical protein